ncbi:MAG: S8 family peptidase, partial [Promethearchaeota archaeon]
MKKSYKNLGLILIGLLIIVPLIFPVFNSIDKTPSVSSNNLNLKLPSSLSLNIENELRENILKSSSEILQKGPNTIGFSTKIDSNLEKYIEGSNSHSQEIKILIKFATNLKASQRGEILHSYIENFNVIYNYQIIPAMFISLSIDYLKELCFKVNNIPEIVSIKLNTAIQLQDVISNTQNFDSNFTTSYTENNWWLDAIGAENTTLTGKGVKLAIMDTGISVHPDFFENGNPADSRIILSKNFTSQNDVSISNYVYDAYGHGTHCAGIAGGNGYLSDGKYSGVAPEVSLINAKISNSTGGIEEADIIAAVDWCVQNHVNIISMSFGGQFPVVWGLESEAIKSAVNSGVVILSSAGNSGPELGTAGSPGSVMYSISVGATDNNNHVTSFSSLGPSFQNQLLPDICAPGRYIIAPESKASLLSVELGYQDNIIQGTKDKYFGYLSLSGTSMACPMAAGAVALLLEAYPNATPETIRNALIMGAIPMERKASEGYGFAQGAGLINVFNSLKYLHEIANETGDVNSQVKSFARQVPYAPFDLLKFPGDSQLMNLTLYAGEAKEISIEYPELDGINFITNISSLKFLQHDLNSFPFIVKIAYNASYGHKIGYIQIKDKNTGQILDEILVNITVAAPRGKILFESYHGLNDLMPFDAPIYSNMELYHYFHDLYQLNYSVKFFQQNLTVDYSSSTDAQILNPGLLSGIDLLVLSPPQLMYSTYEIQVIKDFYENGGNIMFLGTLRNKFLDNSINHLFNELNSNIRIGNQDIFDFTDYARYATYSPKLITEFNNSSPIFQDIDHIFYPFGCSFQNSSGINVLAAYNNLPVVVMDENKVSYGKIIAFGDYHFLKDSFYDSLNDYDQNFHFMKNLMNTLIKHSKSDLYSILCDIDQENQTLNQNDLNFGIRVLNLNNSEPISSLIPTNTINASLILPNLTQTPISLTYDSTSKFYQGAILDRYQNISGVYSIDCQVEIDGQKYNRTFNFLTDNFGTVSY